MKWTLKLYISALLFLVSTIIVADPARYQIELLIFSHIDAAGVNSEQWPVITQPKLNLATAWGLNPLVDNNATTDGLTKTYQLLPNYNFNLTNTDQKLIDTDGYKVLLHIAWQQDLTDPKSAKWIHIFGGNGYDNDGNVIIQDTDGRASYDQAPHWQVDGLLRLDTVRYINSHYKFYFATPTTDIQALSNTDNFAKLDDPLIYFTLNQKRRMRSNELNYIGHPLYGVLVNITKVDLSKLQQNPQPAAAS